LRVELEKQSIDTNVNATDREEGMARAMINITGKKHNRKTGRKEEHDSGYGKLIQLGLNVDRSLQERNIIFYAFYSPYIEDGWLGD
jgi:hypothetical protein